MKGIVVVDWPFIKETSRRHLKAVTQKKEREPSKNLAKRHEGENIELKHN